MFCRECGKELNDKAVICPNCGVPPNVKRAYQDNIPDGVRGWSWGAFLLNWIWAIGNNVWWGLLALTPYLGLIIAIWLGIQGRELAWKTGKWDSVEHFQRVQKQWSKWAVIITLSIITICTVIMYLVFHHFSKSGTFNV